MKRISTTLVIAVLLLPMSSAFGERAEIGPPVMLSEQFVIRWIPPGGALDIVNAQQYGGRFPFSIHHGPYRGLSAITAADLIGVDLMGQAGTVLFLEFQANPTLTDLMAVITIEIDGRADRQTHSFSEGTVEGTAVLSADGAPLGSVTATANLTGMSLVPSQAMDLRFGSPHVDGIEIQGHPDPNCEWSWFECVETNGACDHIVHPFYSHDGHPVSTCFNEECAWGWLWLACGCHKNEVVPCPQDP